VAKCKNYILDGDIMQVQISQRIRQAFPAPPINLYRALRSINPSPYMYFLKMPETTIVGSSPEMLVRVRDREIEYRPIAGTLPRGANHSEDEANAEKLRNDEKERAEHSADRSWAQRRVESRDRLRRVTGAWVGLLACHAPRSNVEGKIIRVSALSVCCVQVFRREPHLYAKGALYGNYRRIGAVKRGIYAGRRLRDLTAIIWPLRHGSHQGSDAVCAGCRRYRCRFDSQSEWEETEAARGGLRAAEMVLGGLDAE
jgi:anthranilate synthase component 1